MKFWTFTLKFFFASFTSSLVFAAAPVEINFKCSTEFPSTTFIVETAEGRLNATVIHHNGAKYAPGLVGTFTPEDIGTLNRKAAIIAKLNHTMNFSWATSDCKVFADDTFQCMGAGEVQDVNGMKVKSYSFYSVKVQESALGSIFRSTRIVLSLNIDGETHFLEMPYNGVLDCRKLK